MTYVMVDIESDGPAPGLYSMIELGAVVVRPGLETSFHGRLKPLESASWEADALAVSGHSREDTLSFPHPGRTMLEFATWLEGSVSGRPQFVSDNNGFDWQFVNWYFHRFLGKNPFGHSSTNLGSLYKGLVRDVTKSFKHLRRTPHTHNPVDDARGNAEAMLELGRLGLDIPA